MQTTAPAELNVSKIPAYQPRTFIPENATLTDPGQIIAQLKRLYEREIASASDLEQWLLDRSELEAVFSEQAGVLHIRMTCQTDDKERAQAWKTYLEKVDPVVKPWFNKLDKKFVEAAAKFNLDKNRYGVYLRNLQTDLELFRDENVPLETQVELLSQEYYTKVGAMMVTFRGQEYTMQQMALFAGDPNQQTRREAWQVSSRRWSQETDTFENIFDKLRELREKIAKNAGFKNYRDYCFKAKHRFDYTPDDCRAYHDGVEQVVAPVWKRMADQRRKDMKLDVLKPWDFAPRMPVDAKGRPSLKPFSTFEEFVGGVEKILGKLEPEFARRVREMADLGLLDLFSRKGKAPGGYQSTLSERRKPFIFMNSVGTHSDLMVLLHESGHAMHSCECNDEPLLAYRHAPSEFCEVASMGMELLAEPYLDVFYPGKDDRRRAVRENLEGIVYTITWVAVIDSFQHWLYENPGHNRQERRDMWVTLYNRYSACAYDWTGDEETRNHRWHRQLHVFQWPFYYIEYGMSQLGALGLWQKSRQDLPATIKQYRAALSLGGSKPLPQIYNAAGLPFDFSAKTMKPLMETLVTEWEKTLG